MPKLLHVLMPVLIAAVCAAAPARAAATESTPAENQANPDFTAGKKAIAAKDWNGAVAAFEKAIRRDAKNADAHNYLGYAYRWLNRMDDSFAHYRQALALDPNHLGANEYIGVAYLKTKQLAKAQEHLARLDKLCGKNCEEYKDLAQAIADYKP